MVEDAPRPGTVRIRTEGTYPKTARTLIKKTPPVTGVESG